jgi:hypothetical protein
MHGGPCYGRSGIEQPGQAVKRQAFSRPVFAHGCAIRQIRQADEDEEVIFIATGGGGWRRSSASMLGPCRRMRRDPG